MMRRSQQCSRAFGSVKCGNQQILGALPQTGGTMRNRTVCYALVCLLLLPALSMPATAEDDPYLGAMNLTATVDSENETVALSWRNIDTVNYQLLDALKTTNYTVLRSDEPITSASYMSAETIAEHIRACLDTDQGGDCRAKAHSYVFTIPPGTDGRYYYGIISLMANGTTGTNLSIGNATLAEPTTEYGTPTSAPYDLQATYNASTSTTELEWIDLSRVDDSYTVNHTTSVWSHALPAHRDNWDNLSKVAVGENLSSGQETFTIHHPAGTDQDRYYTVLHTQNNQTDARLLSGNTLTEAIDEDNIGSVLNGTLDLQFNASLNITSLNWSGSVVEDVNHTLHVWRSSVAINNLSGEHVEMLATLPASATHYNHSVEAGVSGQFYYAVTLRDHLMNDQTQLDVAPSGSVTETTLSQGENIVTNLQVAYSDSVTMVSWSDLSEHSEAKYSVWRSSVGPITSSSLNAGDALLLGVVNATIEMFEHSVSDATSEEAWYAVTASASFGTPGLIVQQTNLSAGHNSMAAPVLEDNIAPTAPSVVTAMYLNNGTVSITWTGTADANQTFWHVYRTGIDATEDQTGWALMEEVDNMGSMVHTIHLESASSIGDRVHTVYALGGVDASGNEITFSNWTLSSSVDEDRETPRMHLQLVDENENIASSRWYTGGEVSTFSHLQPGTYALHLTSSEPLESLDYIKNGIGTNMIMSMNQGQASLTLSETIANVTYAFTALDLNGNTITFTSHFCTSCLIENTELEVEAPADEADEVAPVDTTKVSDSTESGQDINMMLVGLSSLLGLLLVVSFLGRKKNHAPSNLSGLPTQQEEKWTERYIREN